LEVGAEITKTCYEVYHRMPTGIFPEIVYFDDSENDFRSVLFSLSMRRVCIE
jgi:hypothetical protein